MPRAVREPRADVRARLVVLRASLNPGGPPGQTEKPMDLGQKLRRVCFQE